MALSSHAYHCDFPETAQGNMDPSLILYSNATIETAGKAGETLRSDAVMSASASFSLEKYRIFAELAENLFSDDSSMSFVDGQIEDPLMPNPVFPSESTSVQRQAPDSLVEDLPTLTCSSTDSPFEPRPLPFSLPTPRQDKVLSAISPPEQRRISKNSPDRLPMALSASKGDGKHGNLSAESPSSGTTSSSILPYQDDKQWSAMYEELCEYRRQKGHCNVPCLHQQNMQLARWVKRQRYQYQLILGGKRNRMSLKRIESLNDIGFVWDAQRAAWYDRLAELKDFKRKNGHCSVPSNFEENASLATWVKCQRRQYKLRREGKPNFMTRQRIHELEKIGFEWELRTSKRRFTGAR